MTDIDLLLERFATKPKSAALIWRDVEISYESLSQETVRWTATLADKGVGTGSVAVLLADYSPSGVALLLALIQRNAIIVPLLPASAARSPELMKLADPSVIIEVQENGADIRSVTPQAQRHTLLEQLTAQGRSGLILFTSGSTGAPKAVVHDFTRLLQKFRTPRPAMRTINFLLFDHWGGLNTLLHSLFNLSLLVLPERRTPEYVCELIEKHKLELLPSSPSFLNLLLISGAYRDRDLSSLKLITYGSEPMLQSTLARLRTEMPGVELRQTYGLIELGVLRAKSESSDSLWVKVGGEGYALRVVDGLLEIKAASAMLGYMNAPSPFTEDGYFKTGDQVEVKGEYMRFLGRASDLINVGGQKVFPAEVEAVLLDCEGVADAVVYGEAHPLMGKIVCTDIQLAPGQDDREARINIKQFAGKRLDAFKVPVKIRFVTEKLFNDRMKRNRLR